MNMEKSNYYSKYKKYKNKYLKLKRKTIKGGSSSIDKSYQDFFDKNFSILFQKIMEFNTNQQNINSGTLFHIKGGASVKAKALKYKKINNEITNDIDILFINEHYNYLNFISQNPGAKDTIIQKNKENATIKINQFLEPIKSQFPGTWTINVDRNLITIKYNNFGLFDITFYEREDMMSDFNHTLFGQAYNQFRQDNGLAVTDDPEEYIKNILIKQKSDPSDWEEYAISNIFIEKYVAIKGLETYQQHIENIPTWQKIAANPNMLRDHTGQINQKIWQRYVYQSTPEYIQKIRNKFQRYQIKLGIIEDIIEIELFGDISDSE